MPNRPSPRLYLTLMDGRPYCIKAADVIAFLPHPSGVGSQLSLSHFMPDEDRILHVLDAYESIVEAIKEDVPPRKKRAQTTSSSTTGAVRRPSPVLAR